MSYIYKITNLVNGKLYIGKTELTIERRFKQHYEDSKRGEFLNRPLYSAIRKYGIENFSIEEIEKIDLNFSEEREIYWINYYNTYSGEGYNATLGGEGKIIYDYSEIIESYKTGLSYKKVAEIFGCCESTVQKIISENFSPRDSNNYKIKNQKNISQLSLKNEFIRNFDSCAEAARFLVENGEIKIFDSGIRSHIGDVCKGKRKTAYGYKWKFLSES